MRLAGFSFPAFAGIVSYLGMLPPSVDQWKTKQGPAHRKTAAWQEPLGNIIVQHIVQFVDWIYCHTFHFREAVLQWRMWNCLFNWMLWDESSVLLYFCFLFFCNSIIFIMHDTQIYSYHCMLSFCFDTFTKMCNMFLV